MFFQPHNVIDNGNEWEKIVGTSLHMRPIYLQDNKTLQYSRVALQLLGIEDNEFHMKDYYYTLSTKENWTFIFQNLPKIIDPTKRTEIVNILQIHRETPLSLNRFMAFFAGKQLLPLMDTVYRDHFIATLKQWLQFLQQRYPNLISNQMQRIFLDFVKWSDHFFPLWLQQAPFEQQMPSCMWFGPAKESEAYFLYFLYLFGCDVVIIEPDGQNVMAQYGIADFPTRTLDKQADIEQFPFEKPIQIQTITSRASEQVTESLYNTSALNYPWKYAEYETRTRILNTTYDELFILGDAELYLRDGFEDEPGVVYLPVLFAKIEGVSVNDTDFAFKMQKLYKHPMTYTATQFPLLPLQKSNMQFHMRDASTNGQLDVEKMMQLSIWPFKNLQLHAQRNLARTLIRLIEQEYIARPSHQTREQHAQYVFGQIMLMPEHFSRLYQQFDYSYQNPKLFIFKEATSGEMQVQDAVLIVYLSMLGFDIIICSPGATLSIEHYTSGQLLNTHRLERISFDATLQHYLNVKAKVDEEPKINFKRVIGRISKKFK